MRRILALAMLVFLVSFGRLPAATVRVFPKFRAVMNSNGTPVDPAHILSSDPYHPILAARAEKYLVQVDVLMTIGDLSATQKGFHSVAFDVAMQDVSPSADLPGWSPDLQLLDYPPGAPARDPKWADSCDCVGIGDDLLGIILATFPHGFRGDDDPRRNLGVAPYHNGPNSPHTDGEYGGSFVVELDGMKPNGLVTLSALSAAAFDADGNASTDDVLALGAGLPIGVPEPASLILAALGCLAGVAIRRCD